MSESAKTAAEHVPARYVETEDGGRTPEPQYDPSWDKLTVLRWKASLVMSENPGLRLHVNLGRTDDRFMLSYTAPGVGGGYSAVAEQVLSDMLIGLERGLELGKRLAEARA
jgi:hypothetical protein